MNSKVALVTGAGGFIGSHLAEALAKKNWTVRCLLRYGSSGDVGFLNELPEKLTQSFEIRRGDLLDTEFVARCAESVDTIFHLGARIAIPYSYDAPRDTFHVNAIGTLNMLEAARRHGVRRFVHTSTSEVFGTAVKVPMDETHPLKAQSPYAASKIAADKLVESFACSYSLPTVTVRPFNTYGPRQSPRAVISAIIEQCLTKAEIRLGSLWPRRDFTFVEDTVRAFILAAESEDVVGKEINLGTGEDISIGELAEMIQSVIGRSMPVVAEDARERPANSEVGRLLSDNSRAAKLLGWRPEVSLKEGLGRTADWWRSRPPSFGWTGYAV